MESARERYGQLITLLLEGEIQPAEFQHSYLNSFKREKFIDESLFAVLDELFGEVDAYCADPELRADLPEGTAAESH